MPRFAWNEQRERQYEHSEGGLLGGLRSHRGPGGRTRDQLYDEARQQGIEGRSKMTKAQLERALGRS